MKYGTDILIAFNSEVRGGCEEYALNMGRSLQEWYGSVAVAFPRREATRSLSAVFEQAGIRYFPLAIAERGSPACRAFVAHARRFKKAVRLLAELQPRFCFFITPSIQYMSGICYAAAWLNIPSILCFQYVQQVFKFTPSELKYYCRMKRTQFWIAVSEHNKKLLQESFHLDAKDIHVVQNGVDVERFRVTDETRRSNRNALLAQLGLPPDVYLFVTIGAIRKQKGYDLVSPAFLELAQNRNRAHWLWIGDGPDRDLFSSQLRDCGLSGQVHRLGYRRDIPEILLSCDCFVFPSRYEGQPFALLEAMAAGLPVITSDASGITEIVQHGREALVFQNGNIQELSSCLVTAFSDNERMCALARSALVRVQQFSFQNMARQTLDIINQLINKNTIS